MGKQGHAEGASRRLFLRYVTGIAVLWTLVIGGFLFRDMVQERQGTRLMAETYARAFFFKDQSIRFWASKTPS